MDIESFVKKGVAAQKAADQIIKSGSAKVICKGARHCPTISCGHQTPHKKNFACDRPCACGGYICVVKKKEAA